MNTRAPDGAKNKLDHFVFYFQLNWIGLTEIYLTPDWVLDHRIGGRLSLGGWQGHWHNGQLVTKVGHTAWAPEGRERRSQAGPKVPKPARRASSKRLGPMAHRFLVLIYCHFQGKKIAFSSYICHNNIIYFTWLMVFCTFLVLLCILCIALETLHHNIWLQLKEIKQPFWFCMWRSALHAI